MECKQCLSVVDISIPVPSDVRHVDIRLRMVNCINEAQAPVILMLNVGTTAKSIYNIVDASIDVAAGAGAAVNVAKVFGGLAKSVQAMQGLGCAVSILGIGAGIFDIVYNAKKLNDGSKSQLEKTLTLYIMMLQNFWKIRELAEAKE